MLAMRRVEGNIMSIITQTIFTLFAIVGPSTGLIDLCDVVHPDTGTPTLCEAHPEGAPRYDDVVCCDDAVCFEQDTRGCLDGEQPYYCELGDVSTTGVVSCYFEVPSYCDVFPCAPGYQTQPEGAFMCCNGGVCWTIYPSSGDCELDDIYWCDDGVSNEDGTVTCFD